MDLTLVILAAGVGSRYGGTKQLDHIGPAGETIMDYSIYDAINAGFKKVVFIIRTDLKDSFEQHYKERFSGKIAVEFAYQDQFKPFSDLYSYERKKPWGTGHALLSVSNLVNGPFVIINADDFYSARAFELIYDAFKNSTDDHSFFMVGFRLKNTLSDFGTVSRGYCDIDKNSYLTKVTELSKIERKDNKIIYLDGDNEKEIDGSSYVSMNFWGFTSKIFEHGYEMFNDFMKVNNEDPKAEFYIPGIVDNMVNSGKATVKLIPTEEEWMGMTYKEDSSFVMKALKEKVDKGLYPLVLE